MNRRVINSILTKKFNEWVDSIKDDVVKEQVKKNTIITGGAIASLLLGEKVNDFDFYFTNIRTAELVAGYYLGVFNDLHPIPENSLMERPYLQIDLADGEARIKIYMKSAGIQGEKTDPNEYQYFENRPNEEGTDFVTTTLSKADDISGEELETEEKKYRPIFLTDNAITLSGKIQLIIRFYGNADEIHKNYDFVHCTNYWESSTGRVTLRSAAMESLLTKQLTYVGSKYPVCSVIRIRKFVRRGFHINAGQILKILMQISQLDLLDLKVLEEQLVGVDTAYFVELIASLEKQKVKDPNFQVTQPYVASVIDRIFG